MKPRWSEDGVAATEILHAAGYPVARYVLIKFHPPDAGPGLIADGLELIS